jgi:hypothetical protein
MSEIDDLEAYADFETREKSRAHKYPKVREHLTRTARRNHGGRSDAEADAIFARVKAELAKGAGQ